MVSHTFDAGHAPEAYAALITIQGRRAGIGGRPQPDDSFTHEERIASVIPGTGPLTITASIYGLKPGEWSVSATLRRTDGSARGSRSRKTHEAPAEALASAGWSWRRRAVLPGQRVIVLKTRWSPLAPLAVRPGVVPGSLPVLVIVGALIGIVITSALLAADGLAVAPWLVAMLLASLAGLVGAKVWYRTLNPGSKVLGRGWAVDGFLVVTPLAAVALLVAFGLPVGRNLDAAAPALFTTVACGRVGCFLTGCCAGRMSASRLCVWSSNGTVGARRIPTQLIESLAGAVLAGTTTLLLVARPRLPDGALFVTAMAVYFVVRTLLLRSRAEARRFLWQRATASG